MPRGRHTPVINAVISISCRIHPRCLCQENYCPAYLWFTRLKILGRSLMRAHVYDLPWLGSWFRHPVTFGFFFSLLKFAGSRSLMKPVPYYRGVKMDNNTEERTGWWPCEHDGNRLIQVKGKFHEGDCYMLLATTEKGGRVAQAIHFWIGSECSQVCIYIYICT